ncbi:uncharacterized protein LOC143470846 [Clavelina lepadiformis]|uniref:uncharacterized protein LOC143470846 n=1 Tax=Clavelina lepadiformis TaxID=159417 RepID=UPI004042BC0F
MDKVIKECNHLYEEKMTQWEGVELEEFVTEHKRMKEESIKKFDDLEKPGTNDFQVRAKKILKNKMERFFTRKKFTVNADLVFKEVLEEYTACLKKRSHLNLNRVLTTKHKKLVWESLQIIQEQLPPECAPEVYEKLLNETKTVYADVKKRNLKWKAGAGILGSVLVAGSIAATVLLPPILPYLAAAEYSTAGLIAALIAGTAAGGGAVGGGLAGIVLALKGSSEFDFKQSIVTAGLLPLKVALPNAAEVMDTEVFISAMMIKQEEERALEDADEAGQVDEPNEEPDHTNNDTSDTRPIL